MELAPISGHLYQHQDGVYKPSTAPTIRNTVTTKYITKITPTHKIKKNKKEKERDNKN
jgi:hypothetical protein